MMIDDLTNKAVQSELRLRQTLYSDNEGSILTCTASAVFPTPPSPRTATLQLSILSSSILTSALSTEGRVLRTSPKEMLCRENGKKVEEGVERSNKRIQKASCEFVEGRKEV